METDELDPPIEDGRGYRVRFADQRFLLLTDDDVAAFRSRQFPLGMTRESFTQFTESLARAIKNDDIVGVDVRLQGSSAHFFSGWHKEMLYRHADIVEEFRARWDRVPQPFELSRALMNIQQLWPEVSARRPHRRMFDVMFRLGIDPYRSDYDIQICSDDILRKAVSRLAQLGVPEEDPYIKSNRYSFIRNDLVIDVCPRVTEWRVLQSKILGRPVTVAAFAASGPPVNEGDVSSHFRDSDWVIHRSSRSDA